MDDHLEGGDPIWVNKAERHHGGSLGGFCVYREGRNQEWRVSKSWGGKVDEVVMAGGFGSRERFVSWLSWGNGNGSV